MRACVRARMPVALAPGWHSARVAGSPATLLLGLRAAVHSCHSLLTLEVCCRGSVPSALPL
eukprot:14901404-Alexandrium_andersonii.AAC.1